MFINCSRRKPEEKDYLAKRKVLRRVLNWFRVEAEWSVCGSSFQSFGAAEANDLWPYVQVLTSRGGSSKSNVEDRRLREGVYFVRSSAKYIGASPWRHLYVISSILNPMRLAMGNQWSSWRTDSTLSRFLDVNLAAEFCIHCSLLSSYRGNPYRRQLQ